MSNPHRLHPVIRTAAFVLLTAFCASAAGTARSARSKIEIIYQGQSNGDYRIFLFGSDRALVCEEQHLRVVSDGDAVNPVVIECKH
jgi:hypothetical protein